FRQRAVRGSSDGPRSLQGPGLLLPDGQGRSFQFSRQLLALRNETRCRSSRSGRVPSRFNGHAAESQPGAKVHLKFDVHDPWKNNSVKKFNTVHEKLFHAFIVSEDLQVFIHDHPVWVNDAFEYEMAFPKAGMYRVLGDFYPEGATPQLIAKTVFVAGNAPAPAALKQDYSPKAAQNIKVEVSMFPSKPVAGRDTQLRFNITPGEGLEKYLGAWGHMLAASDDL